MKHFPTALLLFALLLAPAKAEVVLVLSDAQRLALIQLIAQGMNGHPELVGNATALLGMIATAPVMTGQQPVPEKGNQP